MSLRRCDSQSGHDEKKDVGALDRQVVYLDVSNLSLSAVERHARHSPPCESIMVSGVFDPANVHHMSEVVFTSPHLEEQGFTETLQNSADSWGQVTAQPQEENPEAVALSHVAGKFSARIAWSRQMLSDELSFEYRENEKSILSFVEKYERENPTPAYEEEETIANSRSEILFVINALLSGGTYEDVWTQLTAVNFLSVLLEEFDDAFQDFVAPPPRNIRDTIAYDASITSAIYGSNDGDDHRHDQETLRKLEFLRAIHEYCHAHERSEVEKLLRTKDFESTINTLVKKIERCLQTAVEDPCAETVACHVLEVFHRCFGMLRSPNIGETSLIQHLFCRIYSFVLETGTAYSLHPPKRIDALMALLGEAIKWSIPNWNHFCEVVRSENVPYCGLPNEVVSGGYTVARGERDTIGNVLTARFHGFPDESNLLLRAILINCMNYMSPCNYVHKPTVETVSLEELQRCDAEFDEKGQRRFKFRNFEVTSVQMQRIVDVRITSRRAVEKIFRARETGEPVGPILADLVRDIQKLSKSAVGPFESIFSEEDINFFLNPKGLLPFGVSVCVQRESPRHSNTLDHAINYNLNFDHLKFDPISVFTQLIPDTAAQLVNLSRSRALDPEAMEGIDKLCVITTTLLLCLYEHKRNGINGLRHLLATAAHIAHPTAASTADPTAVPSTAAAPTAAPPAPPPLTGAAKAAAVRRVGHAGRCAAVAAWEARGRGDFGAAMFRQVCLWLAHYNACQRFIETLYMCSGIAFGEWKYVALAVLRELPNHFRH